MSRRCHLQRTLFWCRGSVAPARPLGPIRPIYPLGAATYFLLLAALELRALLLHRPPFLLSLPSIRPLFPCFRGCTKYTLQARKTYPQGRSIEDEENGIEGLGYTCWVTREQIRTISL
eukprot:2361850-Pyramimonas_sp.AAC.1